jgi:hypothetical protein
MTWPHIHRWGRWSTSFEEAPGGDMTVWEWRTRECKRPNCRMYEEIPTRVSLTAPILTALREYREAS